MDELHTFSTLRQTRILKCCSPFFAERRSVPSRCFWLQFRSAQFALGKLEVLLADTSDDGQHFSLLSAAFFGLLFGVEAQRFRVANSSQRLVDKDIPTEGATTKTTTTRAGEEGARGAQRVTMAEAPSSQAFFRLYDEEDAELGARPGVLAEPRPQERVQRRTVEHIVDFVRSAPTVQILDAPVPQMGDQLPDILHFCSTFTPDAE